MDPIPLSVSRGICRCVRDDPARSPYRLAPRCRRLPQQASHQQEAHPPHGRHRHLLWHARGLRRPMDGYAPLWLAHGARFRTTSRGQLIAPARQLSLHWPLVCHCLRYRPARRQVPAESKAEACGSAHRRRYRRRGRPCGGRHRQPRHGLAHRPGMACLSVDHDLSGCLLQHHQPHRRPRWPGNGHLVHLEPHDVCAFPHGWPS